MSSSGLQAIVMAAGRGSRIPELVSSIPKCLIPIGNRPMIHYPLHALELVKFTEVTIVVNEGQEEAISEAIHNQFQMRIDLFVLPNKDDDYGTAVTLRLMHESNKIFSDFLVISCDTLTNYPLYKLVNLYRAKDAAITVLISSCNIVARGSAPDKGNPETVEKDLFGIDYANQERLVFFNSELEFVHGMPFNRSFVKRCPHYTVHNSFLDTHIYVIKKWVLGYLKEKRQIKSIKADLIPRLVMKQFRNYVNVTQNTIADDLETDKDSKVNIFDFCECDAIYKVIEALNNFKLDHETVESASNERKVYPDSVVKCFALVQREGISLRANTVSGVSEANKRIKAMFPGFFKKDKDAIC